MTAAEFMAELERDPEYQADRKALDAKFEAKRQRLKLAEQPILFDLREAGWDVESVWDFVNTAEPYDEALPILLQHLKRGGYPERVMESLGRALAVPRSIVFWDDLKALYFNAKTKGERHGVAVALSVAATNAKFDDLVEFINTGELGDSRLFFLKHLVRVDRVRAWPIIESLAEDPELGKEASAKLSARDKRNSRKSS